MEKEAGEEESELTPHHAFLIEQVVDNLDTVTHLRLGSLGHGDDGANDLSRFDVIERRNSGFRAARVMSVARPSSDSVEWDDSAISAARDVH